MNTLLAWGIGEAFTEMIFGLHLQRSRRLPGEAEWVKSDSSEGTTYKGKKKVQKKEHRSDYEVNQESKEISLIAVGHLGCIDIPELLTQQLSINF